MGKRFTPSYANIFMANWEEEVLPKCPVKPHCYLRYLDDIWGIWSGTEQQFLDFVNILNAHDPSIQLKMEKDDQRINFLDTTVYKGPGFTDTGRLDVKVFFKPTDTHALLFRSSFHPRHTFRGLVKSQLLRFKRISTQVKDFYESVGILFRVLRTRGYTKDFLLQCLRTFQDVKQKDSKEKRMIPLITTFSTISSQMSTRLKNNFVDILQTDGVLSDTKVISAFRRNKNLKDWLVRARLPSTTRPILDKFIVEKFVHSKLLFLDHNQTVVKVSQHFTLMSVNCVYVVFCKRCNLRYVGDTPGSLTKALGEISDLIHFVGRVEDPLVSHFLVHGSDSVRLAGLQRNEGWSLEDRLIRRNFWIDLLRTRVPHGMNL